MTFIKSQICGFAGWRSREEQSVSLSGSLLWVDWKGSAGNTNQLINTLDWCPLCFLLSLSRCTQCVQREMKK